MYQVQSHPAGPKSPGVHHLAPWAQGSLWDLQREAWCIESRSQRNSMILGTRGQGGLWGALPYSSQSGPRKPGQHLQATETSTFCWTRYTGFWATRYLRKKAGAQHLWPAHWAWKVTCPPHSHGFGSLAVRSPLWTWLL